MKTILSYTHTRNLFTKNEFKPFVKKYFKDVVFLGTECGNWDAKISISNWEEVKNTLPKYAIPIRIKLDRDGITVLEALGYGQLALAREMCGGNENSISSTQQLKW